MTAPLLEVTDLVKEFPVRGKGIIPRNVGTVQAAFTALNAFRVSSAVARATFSRPPFSGPPPSCSISKKTFFSSNPIL